MSTLFVALCALTAPPQVISATHVAPGPVTAPLTMGAGERASLLVSHAVIHLGPVAALTPGDELTLRGPATVATTQALELSVEADDESRPLKLAPGTFFVDATGGVCALGDEGAATAPACPEGTTAPALVVPALQINADAPPPPPDNATLQALVGSSGGDVEGGGDQSACLDSGDTGEAGDVGNGEGPTGDLAPTEARVNVKVRFK